MAVAPRLSADALPSAEPETEVLRVEASVLPPALVVAAGLLSAAVAWLSDAPAGLVSGVAPRCACAAAEPLAVAPACAESRAPCSVPRTRESR